MELQGLTFELYNDCWGNERYYTQVEGEWYVLTTTQYFFGNGGKEINIIQGNSECSAKFGYTRHWGDNIIFDSVAYQDKRLLSFVMGSNNDIKVIDREDFYDLRFYYDNTYLFKETPKEKVTKLWYNIK